MKYGDLVKAYEADNWNKEVYVYESIENEEFKKKKKRIIGIDDSSLHILCYIGGYYQQKDFKKIRKATKRDLGIKNGA